LLYSDNICIVENNNFGQNQHALHFSLAFLKSLVSYASFFFFFSLLEEITCHGIYWFFQGVGFYAESFLENAKLECIPFSSDWESHWYGQGVNLAEEE